MVFGYFNQSVYGGTLPANLRTDLRSEPLGIDNPFPELSWILTSEERSVFQTAYEIWLGTDITQLETGNGLNWKTGRTEDNHSSFIKYKGQKIKSFTRYYWKVRIWDAKGLQSAWSPVTWFETSMLSLTDWKAKWITNSRVLPENDPDYYKEIPNPLLRKDIKINSEIKSARLYITGLGYYVAFINGRRVGDQMLDPGLTQYNKEVLYSTYDITEMLSRGENAIGVMLGNGWYNPLPIRLFNGLNLRNYYTIGKPCLKAQILIKYADGTSATITTDDTWKAGDGPVLKNSVYLGEMYDARKYPDGWDKAPFDDSKWESAVITEGPKGLLTAQYAPPVRITKILRPIKLTEPKHGIYLFDFGQNFAGVPRLKVKGPVGSTVVLRGGEDIHKDGTLNFLTVIAGQLKSVFNLNGGEGCPPDPVNTITYILKGDGEETYTPQFTFSTYRYLEVTGYPGTPDLNSVEGLRMNSDLQENGSFECSNEMFNKLQEAIKWTFLSNVFSIQSDCPAREKFGYGADIVTTSEAFCYNFDMSGFYRKVVRDFANDVRPLGGMTETAPYNGLAVKGIGDQSGALGWQLAFPYCLKQLYNFYNDSTVVKVYYETLKRQIGFIRSVYPNFIVPEDISDHESIDPKPESLTATAFYLQHVELLAEFAGMLGIGNDKAIYKKLAGDIRNACIHEFVNPNTGIVDNGTQASQLFAIYHGLVPIDDKEAAMKRLIEEIFYKHKGHLSTGIFATKYLFDVSRTENRNDIAYAVANQRLEPGYGYMLGHGATTLWESWAYPDTVNSQNHPMFGSVGEWFYRSLLGINSIEPGFAKFYIKPQPAADLIWAKGYYNSISGHIACEWKTEGIKFSMKVTVPANTKAIIYIPAFAGKQVNEGEIPASESQGLKFLMYQDGYALFDALSGDYSFTSVIGK